MCRIVLKLEKIKERVLSSILKLFKTIPAQVNKKMPLVSFCFRYFSICLKINAVSTWLKNYKRKEKQIMQQSYLNMFKKTCLDTYNKSKKKI